MKKILSLGIASAVLALTAVSASAAVIVKSDSDVKKGATITVDFVADEDVSSLQFTVEPSAGLTLTDNKPMAGLAQYNENTNKFGVVGAVKNGDVVLTLTYTVTADVDAPISVNVKDIVGGNATVTAYFQSIVKSDTASTPGTSDPGTTSSTTPSGTTSSTTTDPGTNPPTGVALAVFPAVIAGAAVVVAKKKRG